MLTRVFIGIVLLALAGYGTLEALPLLLGPTLTIVTPTDYAVSDTSVVNISGTATRAVHLTLNGAPLLADQDGAFSKTLAFPRGDTILTFVAKDRFGRTITTTRTISTL